MATGETRQDKVLREEQVGGMNYIYKQRRRRTIIAQREEKKGNICSKPTQKYWRKQEREELDRGVTRPSKYLPEDFLPG